MNAQNKQLSEYLSKDEKSEMFFSPLNKIHKKEGFNPRKFISEVDRAPIREDIRANGVHTPIIVRPHPSIEGEFELAAGHTRYDLSVETGKTSIPVICRDATDEEMLEIALRENLFRAAMNPIDEGEAAKKLLLEHKGDESEVRKILGWSPKKLKARIQLTYAVDSVAQALSDGVIKLGHAELLCSLRESAQEGGLKLVLDQKLSVEDTRKRIASKALELSTAFFDTNECASCPHNTSPQVGLFETGYEGGRCLNSSCFQEKSDNSLNELKEKLSENYHMVSLDTECAKGTFIKLLSSGDNAVGTEQIDKCASCLNNRAIIQTTLGNRGNVIENLCFDLGCHATKVEAYKSALIASDKIVSEVENGEGNTDPSATTKSKAANKNSKPTPDVAAIPKKIIGFNHNVHRKTAAHFVGLNSQYTKAVALIAVIKDSKINAESLKVAGLDVDGSYMSDRSKLLSLLSGKSETELDKITQRVVCYSLESSSNSFNEAEPENDSFGGMAISIIKGNKLDLAEHFVMSETYLEPHTKPSIKVMLEKSSFNTFYEEKNGEGSFAKLVAMKKGDMLKAIKESEFDWKGFIPDSMKLDK